jgi:vacuolar-type H+-ATPase subunit I/STV1
VYDYYGKQLDLSIYFVVFPLGSSFLRDRLKKVCDSFLGEKFNLPRTKEEIYDQLNKSKNALDNLFNTLEFTVENFKKYLVSIQHSPLANGHSILQVYKMYLRKARLIQVTLNKLKSDRSLLIGLLWVP